MQDRPLPPALSFLAGGGALGALIADFDWGRTAVGAIDAWPVHMKAATALMLRCQLPIVMLWQAPGVMVYNDAYSEFAAARHPQLLGSNVREGWPEVAAFNDNVMAVCMAGGTLNYQDQELTLHRHGRAEQVWMNLDYSPLLDAQGQPAGVMAIVVETTAKVRTQQQLRGERERFAQLFAQAPTFMAMLAGAEHRIELANPNYMQLVGHRPVLGLTVAQALPDAAAQGYVDLLDQVFQSGQAYSAVGSRYAVQAQPGGPTDERFVDFVFQPIRDALGSVTGIFVEGVDMTERVAAESRREARAALADRLRDLDDPAEVANAAAQLLGQLLGVSRVGYGTIDAEAGTLAVESDWTANGVPSIVGTLRLRDFGSFIDGLQRNEFIAIDDVAADPRTAAATPALVQRNARAVVNVPLVEHGRLVAVLFVNHAEVRHWSDVDCAFIREVADRTRTAVERARAVAALRASEARLRLANETLEAKVEERTQALQESEARYRQAQKMEAIGQLTGGLAHDFNNLLAGMSASLQILQKRLSAGKAEGAERYIDLAQQSVRRAAALTHRLLAFSRRQTLDAKPADVNRLVAGLEELIRRTVGPAVHLEVVGAGGLWPTKVDAPQLESAILNLCINARDAMALGGDGDSGREGTREGGREGAREGAREGGRLTIETANKWLDARSAAECDLPPGQYISVCVTDTGAGMAKDVIARAFDPFFTTKPVGQGTGLGLSMVYGFVRQSGGQVRVYSELGRGTTMCLYLPRFVGDVAADAAESPATADDKDQADGECVLAVEDDTTIRELIVDELTERGYRVIAVGDGPAALRVLQSDTRVDLLLSDVGLPGGLNGRQVADAARVNRPDLKVLFLTGYAENAALRNGLLAHGMEVLTKPFDLETLAARVRELIER